jgi:NTE family protein
MFCELQAMRRAIRHLRPNLPPELAGNPHWKLLDSLSCDAAITIVQLIHRRAAHWTQSNDYEFSRYTMEEHWAAGRADVERTHAHPAWKERKRPEEGVAVLDLTRELDLAPEGATP